MYDLCGRSYGNRHEVEITIPGDPKLRVNGIKIYFAIILPTFQYYVVFSFH